MIVDFRDNSHKKTTLEVDATKKNKVKPSDDALLVAAVLKEIIEELRLIKKALNTKL